MFIYVSKGKVFSIVTYREGKRNVIVYGRGSEIAPYALRPPRTPEGSP